MKFRDEEKLQQLNNDLQSERIECAAWKDEVVKLKKEKALVTEQKASELRKIRDELFNVNREKMESEIAKKRFYSTSNLTILQMQFLDTRQKSKH